MGVLYHRSASCHRIHQPIVGHNGGAFVGKLAVPGSMTSLNAVSSSNDDESMAFRIKIIETKLMLGVCNVCPKPHTPVSHLHQRLIELFTREACLCEWLFRGAL